jgi:dihydroorotate dehydrogenase electron transfer subunit
MGKGAIMVQQEGKVKWNKPVGQACFHIGVTTSQAFAAAVPGQFVMLQVGAQTQRSTLLRRPFSIFGLFDGSEGFEGIELLIKVVGKATRRLSLMRPGDSLDLIGPLGHGFRIDTRHDPIYLAAGGIGVAPIRFLSKVLIQRGVLPQRCRLFLGGRSKHDLLFKEEFVRFGVPVTVTTDDGSDGNQCLITDPLELAINEQTPDMVYACGPHGMLACVAGIVERAGVSCQISIETLMACGLGACLGCAVPSGKDPDAYLHACVNGPVFNAGDIRL